MADNKTKPSSSSFKGSIPRAAPGDYNSIAAQYARAKAAKDVEEDRAARREGRKGEGRRRKQEEGDDGGEQEEVEDEDEDVVLPPPRKPKSVLERINDRKAAKFRTEWFWVLGFFVWLLIVHASGIYFFTKGFLLTRLVLEEKSSCGEPPIALGTAFKGAGTPEAGCWHQKSFDKAVVLIIDALRYDFTIPYANTTEAPAQAFHNALPFLYETAVREPHNAFLLPFIADPPTTTLQRLKGLTTGTLPTFVDAGSNFAGTAIEEDNLLMQLKDAGRRIAHLGDDTWTALFPGYFETNLSRAYDSLNVWDLHTLDNGVMQHIFPLLQKQQKDKWDVLIAHFLGVDHAGHRYGPNHPAMTAKLAQMNEMLTTLVETLDDDTLLVVMGDHGMDGKGDHGGESDDEVQAALWMYSRKGIFGRTDPSFFTPPQTAKERPVNQIDLVPTLALLLGLPIPFNNLGKPIEEAFAGRKGNAWENLASVARMTAAGIKRYQAAYYLARGIDESTVDGSPYALWAASEAALTGDGKQKGWKEGYVAYSAFQEEVLRICRSLWARFDVPCMILGIGILAGGLLALMLFANSNAHAKDEVDDPEVDRKELQAEIDTFAQEEKNKIPDETTCQILVRGALMGSLLGTALGPALWIVTGGDNSILDFGLAVGSVTGVLGVLYQEMRRRMEFSSPFPATFWGWLAVIFTVSQSIGFASNSYTIWEDSITLYFISTFGAAALVSSFRLEDPQNRSLGIYHSIIFVVLGWVASFSKLCREEQMPYCRSTYYASATSSTSAPWQLLIPFLVAAVLPTIIKSFYTGSRSYEGFAPIWIGWVFRAGLLLSAVFWTLDAADDGEWFPTLPAGILKNVRVPIAQTIFAIAIGAGTTAFIYAPPCVTITTSSPSLPAPAGSHTVTSAPGSTVTILGFANTHGTRYFLLVTNILLCVLVAQKPMGGGAIALMAWQILSLLEILDLNALTTSPIGPIVLALLGSFHFFKTGHQATLSSIQWESAFIPMHTIMYPWSPLLVALNSFGAQVLAAAAVPLVVLWKQKPRKKGILKSVGVAMAWHVLYYATVGLATTMWAGHLRRHLMLYRIFSPKFMMSALVLLVVDVVGILVALGGVRWNTASVGDIFGWG